MSSLPNEHTAPAIAGDRLLALQRSVSGLDREQLIWGSGFLAGLAAGTSNRTSDRIGTSASHSTGALALATVATSPQPASWTVFYATETGNSKRVAEELATASRAAGIAIETKNLRDIKPRSLLRIENALFVLATHGIGDAPEGTEAFFEFWFSDKAPRLESLNYSVLALGDSSYVDFCEVGRRFDKRLAALGASALRARVECDLDFAPNAKKWTSDVVTSLRKHKTVVELPRATPLPAADRTIPVAGGDDRDPYSKEPVVVEVLSRQVITGPQSSKVVQHIELDVSSLATPYLPGDSIAVLPANPQQTVDQILTVLGVTGSEQVRLGEQDLSLAEVLRSKREITQLSRPVLDAVAATQPALQSILADRQQFAAYLASRQLVDLLNEFPLPWQPQKLVETLRPLTARKYSVASCPDSNEGEAHLTVAVVDYEKFGRRHLGAASAFLAGPADSVAVYVERNEQFRLPENGESSIIMIGAGTGVAPYRSFVEHRREHGHRGRNWLIFGDRSFDHDFLYQLEWLRYRKEGTLSRLDVAFSRDQREKQYVQHRIRENGTAIYSWLQDGASIYVCGNADRMAVDVEAALLDVARQAGGLSFESARDWLRELRQARRYQKDVY